MNVARLNDRPEIFYSLQGEGASQGTPSLFLRLAGCNLACRWCDTAHAWKRGEAVDMSPNEIAIALDKAAPDCRRLVVTGGEPLLQGDALEDLLLLLGHHHIEIETNGTLDPSDTLLRRVDQWNVSPKLAHAGHAADRALRPVVLRNLADTGRAWFKFVVANSDDWPEIDELIRTCGLPKERILLMPQATTREELAAAREGVVALCLQHGVRYADRLHIAIWGDKKGV